MVHFAIEENNYYFIRSRRNALLPKKSHWKSHRNLRNKIIVLTIKRLF